MDYITAERLGRVLIWAWNKYVKKTAIPYKEIDFHYPDWVFLLTGLVFCGIALGNETMSKPGKLKAFGRER